MRILTFEGHGGLKAGRLQGDRVVELAFPDVATLLREAVKEERDWRLLAESRGTREYDLESVLIAPIVAKPTKTFCVGLNYLSHVTEMGRETPKYPTLFAKFPCAFVGSRDDILLPALSDRVDWEAEVGVIIGSPTRYARGKDASRAIAGYTVANDVTARDWQRRTKQFLQGKTFDRTTPIGPVLVSADELEDVNDLELRCTLDGEVMQEARTSDLLFDQFDLVEYASQICTLEPGDIILTGTPGGVGDGRQPPVYLQEGQVLETFVEGVGMLRNRCVKEERPCREGPEEDRP